MQMTNGIWLTLMNENKQLDYAWIMQVISLGLLELPLVLQ